MKIIELKNKLGQILVPKKWEPIGKVLMFAEEVNMSAYYYGTWELACKGRSPLGAGTFDNTHVFEAGQTGGEYEHTLTISELAEHNHEFYLKIQHSDGQETSSEALTCGLQVGGKRRYTSETYEKGGNQPHNNIHPYEVFYFYKRVA